MSFGSIPTLLVSAIAILIKTISSNIFILWRFLRVEIYPMKGRQYFMDRFLLDEKIVAVTHHKALPQISVLLALSFILSLVQCLYDHPIFMLVTFDYFGLYKLSANVKLAKALVNIATYYFYKYMYYNLKRLKHFKYFRSILLENDRTFVMGSRFDFWKCILYSLKTYQILVVAFEVWLVVIYIQLGVALSHQSFPSVFHWFLAYLSMSISFVLFSVTCLLMCAGPFSASIALLLICVLFERINMQRRRFLDYPGSKFTAARLLRYRYENTKSMQCEFDIASVYGPMLLTFMWTNIPMNVSFIVILISNNTNDVPVLSYGIAIVVFGKST